jgi:DNA-nicking Smr family endonuclease
VKDALAAVRKALAQQRAADQAAARAAAQAQARALREANLFRDAVGPVTPLPGGRARKPMTASKPAAVPRQRQADERQVLQASLSDDFDIETLLETDDQLSYRRSGIGPEVVRKLRRGVWRVQAELDLHGLRRDEAREAMAAFVREARREGWRCVRVVHGKGLGSPGKHPVLKGRVQSWLAQHVDVLAFVQARPADGGAGALLVLLQAPGLAGKAPSPGRGR